MQFWHMQMHPDGELEFAEKIPEILEHHQFIGLGDWEEGQTQIAQFREEMAINDIVAVRKGQRLIALVKVIGGAYQVTNDQNDELGWIVHRRLVRVLDWAIRDDETIRQSRGTLMRCVSEEAETTQTIKFWYENVKSSYQQRGLQI